MSKVYNLELSVDQVQIIVNGLQELPAKTANPLIQNIINQVNTQNGAETVPNEEERQAEVADKAEGT